MAQSALLEMEGVGRGRGYEGKTRMCCLTADLEPLKGKGHFSPLHGFHDYHFGVMDPTAEQLVQRLADRDAY